MPWVQTWPTFAQVRPPLSELGRIWSNVAGYSVKMWPKSAEPGQNVGRCLATVGQQWPNLDQIRPNKIRPKQGRTWPMLGQIRPTVTKSASLELESPSSALSAMQRGPLLWGTVVSCCGPFLYWRWIGGGASGRSGEGRSEFCASMGPDLEDSPARKPSLRAPSRPLRMGRDLQHRLLRKALRQWHRVSPT